MAVTFDFGKCASCGESNSKSLPSCRKCGAMLPWAKAVAPKSVASHGDSASKPGLSVSDVAWGAIGTQILGGLVFVAGMFFWAGNVLRFFPTFPGVGYITMLIGGVIWRVGLSMD